MRSFFYVIASISMFFYSCAPSKSVRMDSTTTVRETQKVEAKYVGPKRRIAVVEFENKTAYGQRRLGQAATDILITELFKSGKFIVVERDKMNKIIEEQKLQQGGMIDPQTAVKLGQILGVEAIVVGAVSEFGVRKEGSDYLLAQSKQQVAEVSVDIRVIDVQTGQVILADSGKGITKSKKASFLGMGTKGGYDETLEGEALRAAIVKFVDNIANQLNKKPWSATIADASGDEIYINAGSNSNVDIGLKLSCFSQGKEIRDPKSNLVIGYREEYLGDFEVIRYCGDSGDCSIAKALRIDKSPKSGDICRLK
ncbi:MAG: CsgG/HfaB family protein [Elusimicrobiales bacterium]